jgi:lipoprotein signal peptidase
MKKTFLVNLGLLTLSIILDQLTKKLAGSVFGLVKNTGLLLNMLHDLPIEVKVISLGTFAGVLFFFYLTFLYLFNLKLQAPRFALSFLMAGILSNTLDKILFGYTVDFIPLGSFAFNVADIMTLGGSFSLVVYMIKFQHVLWTSADSRRSLFINPKAQLLFSFKYVVVSLCTSLLLGLMAFTYIKNFVLPNILSTAQNFLTTFIVLHLTLTLFFSLIVFIFGIIISHRFVGPIVALERYVNDLNQGKDSPLNLRQGDYFKQIEELGRKIKELKKSSDVD